MQHTTPRKIIGFLMLFGAMATIAHAAGTQDPVIPLTGTDFDPTYIFPLLIAAMGAWLVASLTVKGAIAGLRGLFNLIFRGTARIIGH